MKKIILFCMVALIMSACKRSTSNETYMNAREFQYKGHDYIHFYYMERTGVVHSPECKKCYDMFD